MLGAVLAGGASRRLGAPKPVVELAGKPLIEYPLAALRDALETVVVSARPDTKVDGLALAARGVEVWPDESDQRHPLAGVVAVLRRATSARVLVCACDLPFVGSAHVERLAAAAPAAAATLAVAEGVWQPQFAVYSRACLDPLEEALERSASFTAAAQTLDPRLVEFDAPVLFNVNTPADLAEAERRLAGASR